MPGKITYLRPDEFPSAGWIKPFDLSDSATSNLEGALGRELTGQERKDLSATIARFRAMRAGLDNATMQDTKRTLAAFARLHDSRLQEAFGNCDTSTQAELEESLWCLRETDDNAILYDSTPAQIRCAAADAHRRVTDQNLRGGRPIKGYQILFAAACINWWRVLGGRSEALWRKDEDNSCSPFLTWAITLYTELEGPPFDWSKAQKLLRKALR